MTTDTTVKILLAVCLYLVLIPLRAELIFFHSDAISGTMPIRSSKSLRDAQIVKQASDHSCGAASLATLLQFYGEQRSEKDLMQAMNQDDSAASFEDMAIALKQFGFVAEGIALSFEQLVQLQIPVIAYLKPERGDHFTVIRGVSPSHVWLGDPSWGNRVLTKARFLEMWHTRGDPTLIGKILVVQPNKPRTLSDGAFDRPPVPRHPLVLVR